MVGRQVKDRLTQNKIYQGKEDGQVDLFMLHHNSKWLFSANTYFNLSF